MLRPIYGLAFLAAGWLAYDHAACCLMLFLVMAFGIYGFSASPYGYASLFFAITFGLVITVTLDDPVQAFDVAIYRVLEVCVGTASAVALAMLFASAESAGSPAVVFGWGDPFGVRWPGTVHAVRAGVAAALIPLVWSSFYLPGRTGMEVTIAAVMAVPVASEDQTAVVISRAAFRILGCFIGGALALALIAAPLTELLPWLGAVWIGTCFFAWLQASPSGAGYVATQAAIVFIMTLIQGLGPPASILPAVDRFTGITLGLVVLALVAMVVHVPARKG